MQALSFDAASGYVAGAYVVFLALILVYVAIMASKLVRIERQVSELDDLAAQRDGAAARAGEPGPGEDPRAGGPREPVESA